MTGPWDELGISATPDAAAIRRAYAARLKQTRPDEDPEGFTRLRAAYEAALAMAADMAPAGAPADGQREPWDEPRDEDDAFQPEPPSPGDPHPAPDEGNSPAAAEQIAISREIMEALGRRDVSAAAASLASAREAGKLWLVNDMALADRLLVLLAVDRTLADRAVLDAAMRLGWYGGPEPPPRSPLLDRLRERIDAQLWLAALRQDAASRRYYLGSRRAAAARLMLGRGRIGLSRVLPPEPPLRRMMSERYLHERWVAHAFDADRTAAVQRMAQRRSIGTGIGTAAKLCLSALAVLACVILLRRLPNWAGGSVWVSLLVWRATASVRKSLRLIILALGVLITAGVLLSQVDWDGSRVASILPGGWPAGSLADLQRRAWSGDARAELELGEYYMTGNGVAADPTMAAQWFRRAAPALPEAAAWLGFLSETGQGVPGDFAEARRFYLDAATRGDASAQVDLAALMNAGRGGPADAAGAFQWNLRAARQGNPRALNSVGYSYLIGRGVERDPVRAALWLRSAAEAGQPNAMHTLAGLYLDGNAVPASPSLAYYWLSIALRTYPKNDEKRASAETFMRQLAPLLSGDQKATLDENARAWTPQAGRAPE